MALPSELQIILERIETGSHTPADLATLRQHLITPTVQTIQQFGSKYNINIGQGQDIQIGDRHYTTLNDNAIEAIIEAITQTLNPPTPENHRPSPPCQNRQTLTQYLETTLTKLQQRGSLTIRQNTHQNGITFNAIATILDFEPGLGMRGEAHIHLAEFATLTPQILQNYATQSLRLAKANLHPNATSTAFYNARIPAHLCFAIALTDSLDPKTAHTIRTTNPFQHSVDALWYSIPIAYELNTQQLHYYTQPTNFWENFRGEIIWKMLRPLIQDLFATPCSSLD